MAAVLSCAAASCGDEPGGAGQAQRREPVIEQLEERNGLGSRELHPSWRTLADVLPGGGAQGGADLIVVGNVASVEAGPSYRYVIDDSTGRSSAIEVGFNSDEAVISTVHVTMTVEAGRSSRDGELPREITFGLSLLPPAEPDAVATDLRAHDAIAVALTTHGPFDSRERIWNVLGYGDMVGLVDGETVRFPLVATAPYPPGFLPSTITVTDLTG